MSRRKRGLRPEQLSSELRSPEGMGSKELKTLWMDWYGKPPPLRLRRHTLSLGIAYQMQTRSLDALSKSAARTLDTIADKEFAKTGLEKPISPLKLKPGTKLVRERHGVVHEVTVIKDGFVWRGEVYRSLSAVARAITGTNWNGHVFFGLKTKNRSGSKRTTSSKKTRGDRP